MSKNIKKIMACIDLSEYSQMTLEYALELAILKETQVVVFNVINLKDVDGVQMTEGYFPGYFSKTINMEDYVNELKKVRVESLEKLIKEICPEDHSMISIKIDVGTPCECILEMIETEGIDLIVMANKGRGDLSRFLFGSNAEKVFRHSSVPVLSVRDRKKFKRKE